MREVFSRLLNKAQVILMDLGSLKAWAEKRGNLTTPVSCLELPVPEPEEQSRPRKPTLQPVLQLKARRRLDKVSIAPTPRT